MKQQLNAALHRIAARVFETLAFMFVMAEDEREDAAWQNAQSRTVCVNFHGPFSGALYVSMPVDALAALSSNMLGTDPDKLPRPDNEHDALKELANVVCGNLLPAIAGPEPVFDVAAPEFVPDGIPDTLDDELRPAAQTHLLLSDGVADLTLFVRDQDNFLAA